VRTDLVKLWLTVALAGVLAVATVVVNRPPATAPTNVAAADQGALLFQAKGCSGCHSITGVAETASIGPNLTRLASVAGERVAGLSAEEYVTQSIRDPQAFTVPDFGPDTMPTLQVSDTELEVLVEFLLTNRQP
jgi:cytochrome c oxidase subunit 2